MKSTSLQVAGISTVAACGRFRVLLVDDEPDVHAVTSLVLSRFDLDGRGLQFLHAYSAAEARVVLQCEPEIALAVIDVVMEDESAGLELARWMREDLKNSLTRIIFRTGQLERRLDENARVDWDVSEYTEKSELDCARLFAIVHSALRDWRDLTRFEEMHRRHQRFLVGLATPVAHRDAAVEADARFPD